MGRKTSPVLLVAIIMTLLGSPCFAQQEARTSSQEGQLARPSRETARLCVSCQVFAVSRVQLPKPREKSHNNGFRFLRASASSVAVQLNVGLFSWRVTKYFPFLKAETPTGRRIKLKVKRAGNPWFESP